MAKHAIVTGAGGLIGSEATRFLAHRGWSVYGIDNNMRRDFFGADGDVSANLQRLSRELPRFSHHAFDIRDRAGVSHLVGEVRPDLVIHAAAQPSHDLAARRPFDDFEVNAVGTLNLLEAVRERAAEAVFVFMSTNKVYGDAPNEIPVIQLDTRYDYSRPEDWEGVTEQMRIDASMHSLFGVSKAAADLMVQEYGRYFGLATVCFRGGCLTGPHHEGAELHGFLAYLARAVREGRSYRIYGYKGKQVRDNIHSLDVCNAIMSFYAAPTQAAVYNLGGGRENSVSVLEAIDRLEDAIGNRLAHEYVPEARLGDHICYISNTGKFARDYPEWSITVSLEEMISQFASRQ